MLFSQRYGYKSPREAIQRESMDGALRNTLWNVLHSCYWELAEDYDTKDGPIKELITDIWKDHLKQSIDKLRWSSPTFQLNIWFFKCEWFEVYDFIEFVVQNNIPFFKKRNEQFMALCNETLEKEMSAYRFVGKHITEITSEIEINTIEDALSNSSPIKTVQQHLQTALALMTDKKQPDYRNSIKESISAVESICKIITQNQSATLGQALNIIEKSGQVGLHSALKDAYSKLYGYTNDADGIRHALKDHSTVEFEDAKFMLVSCSAFINYLISKSKKAGLDLK